MRYPSGRPIRSAFFTAALSALAMIVSGCTLNWDPLLPNGTAMGCGTLGMRCCSTDAAPAECITGLACNAGTCGCGAGATMCGATCVDTTTSASNCGACGTTCGMNETCVASACVMRCTNGQTMCGTACVDTARDTANCGDCGHACGSGQTCRNSTCM